MQLQHTPCPTYFTKFVQTSYFTLSYPCFSTRKQHAAISAGGCTLVICTCVRKCHLIVHNAAWLRTPVSSQNCQLHVLAYHSSYPGKGGTTSGANTSIQRQTAPPRPCRNCTRTCLLLHYETPQYSQMLQQEADLAHVRQLAPNLQL